MDKRTVLQVEREIMKLPPLAGFTPEYKALLREWNELTGGKADATTEEMNQRFQATPRQIDPDTLPRIIIPVDEEADDAD